MKISLLRQFNILGCLAVLAAAIILPSPGQAATPMVPEAVTNERPLQFDDCNPVGVQASNATFEAEVVLLVNQIRAGQGLPPLKRVSNLDQAARAHAEDMGQEKYMAHDSQSPNCVWSARISLYYSGWNTLSENIASGHPNPQAVVDAWMNSEGHRNNILSDGNCEIGVGYAPDGKYGTSWVQDFGCRQRSDIYPVIINQETAATTSPSIDLYVYGSWSEVRLRNNDGAWSNWQAFNNSIAWQLPEQAGTHTVTVEMRKDGKTVSASDSVRLDLPLNIDFTDFVYIPLVNAQSD
jgi:uncharacterized protein YkwD